jgi:hypothetical protein
VQAPLLGRAGERSTGSLLLLEYKSAFLISDDDPEFAGFT